MKVKRKCRVCWEEFWHDTNAVFSTHVCDRCAGILDDEFRLKVMIASRSPDKIENLDMMVSYLMDNAFWLRIR